MAAECHDHYERQGFVRLGSCADPRYPSGALFQKAAEDTLKTDTSRLAEDTTAESRAAASCSGPPEKDGYRPRPRGHAGGDRPGDVED